MWAVTAAGGGGGGVAAQRRKGSSGSQFRAASRGEEEKKATSSESHRFLGSIRTEGRWNSSLAQWEGRRGQGPARYCDIWGQSEVTEPSSLKKYKSTLAFKRNFNRVHRTPKYQLSSGTPEGSGRWRPE